MVSQEFFLFWTTFDFETTPQNHDFAPYGVKALKYAKIKTYCPDQSIKVTTSMV